MMRYFLASLVLALMTLPSFAQKTKQKVKKLANPVVTSIEDDWKTTYHFEKEIARLNKEIAAAKKRKQPTETLEAELQKIKLADNMLISTKKICFVDSFVVKKKDFLATYKLDASCGKIIMEADSISSFTNEMGDQFFSSMKTSNGMLGLYAKYRTGDKWDGIHEIEELNGDDGDRAYPFVMSDGVTLYFAAKGEESIGGYDIFVTRFDSDTKQFLKPENIGMPFNSFGNDYLYVVDEVNNLAWFATDRNQESGKIVVYVFIPPTASDVYDTNGDDESLIGLAQLHSVKASQEGYEANEIAEAKKRLASAIEGIKIANKKHDLFFVKSDDEVYTSFSQFKTEKARNAAKKLVEKQKSIVSLENQLEKLRYDYAKANKTQKQGMTANIVSLESNLTKARAEVKQMENDLLKMM